MINTGALCRLTVRYSQYLVYKGITKDTNIDIAQASTINVQFGISLTPLISLIIVDTLIRNIDFHVVRANTPFLLYLVDMDNLRTYYNNVTDTLITLSVTLLITRRFGHLFLLQKNALYAYIQQLFDQNLYFLTDTKIRRLYRRFGHPLAEKLYKVLERLGHEVNKQALN